MLGTPPKNTAGKERRRYGHGAAAFFVAPAVFAAGSLQATVHGICPTDSASPDDHQEKQDDGAYRNGRAIGDFSS